MSNFDGRRRARRHHPALRPSARLLVGPNRPCRGHPRPDDRAGARPRRRPQPDRDRRDRPRLRRRGHDGRGARARAEADRDPARGRARERRAQPQCSERLARIDGRRARRHRSVRPVGGGSARPARRGGLRGLARTAAGSRRLGHRPRARDQRQQGPSRASGGRQRAGAAGRRGGRWTDRSRRELRVPSDADRRRVAALEHRLPGPAPRGGRGRPSGHRVPLPPGLRRRHRRLGLLVRQPRGQPAQLRAPGRVRPGDRRRRARGAGGDRDDRRRRARSRIDLARAPAPPDRRGIWRSSSGGSSSSSP